MTHLDFSIHPAAIEEAVEAARWYRERSPTAAARFVEELNLVIEAIVEAPQRWPRGITPTRKVKLPFFSFPRNLR